ncbi:transcription/translation regulatory transformer protein RfaH [Pseudoalteromonas xiamenensis]|uniref:transcription/translation regulatory transformer protein RfaH n=1 Tax=Pseudoalteromonas xiamenensis TaxID=882626 RepID=UPI0027E52605|nr:transcription/translation regulatory transformer protein RfaH [Pseudoalteromonas xiamenensis]WMN61190.1 transcription/translation regulatory transformer protein RfaH [Pseudoalteromonas xiamenensis]
MEQWYLLYCKPKQEQRALENLANQGIESFFPAHLHSKLSRGRRVDAQKPLFPNYLFVKLDVNSGLFSRAKNTRGVSSFVMYGAEFQVVSNAIIDALKAINPKDYHFDELPKKGEAVVLNNDAYHELDAIYLEADGDKRCILLLQLLNKDVKISVKNSDIARRA